VTSADRGAVAPFPRLEIPPGGATRPLWRILWLIACTALAIVFNTFAPALFSGHSLVLGVVCYWIAVPVAGPLPALLTLAAATVTLAVKWGQPFSALLMALEGLAVGFAWRRGRNPLVADLLFWVLIGTPLSWFLYHRVFPIPQPALDQALWVQPINGLMAVWIAFLLLDQIPMPDGASLRRPEQNFRTVLLRRYIVFGTFPVVIATLVAVGSFEKRSVEEAGGNLQAAANTLADAVDRQVSSAKLILRNLSTRLQRTEGPIETAELQRNLDIILSRSTRLRVLLAVDKNGRVLAAASSIGPPAKAVPPGPQPFAPPRLLDDAGKTRRIEILGLFRSRILPQESLVVVTAPMLDTDGRVTGFLEGWIPISDLAETLRRGADGTRVRALLSNDQDIVVTQVGFRERPLEKTPRATLARTRQPPSEKPLRLTDERGDERVSYLSTQVRITDLAWTLTLQREWRDVIHPVVEAYSWSLLIIVTTLIVASFFATWSLRDLLHAWRDLITFSRDPTKQAAALRNSAGLRLPLEFGELIRNFNGMAERMETERRGREELLVQLETRVRERTAELEQAVTRAQSADRAKGAFLATVSHELRTPLTAIVTAVRLLRMMPTPRSEAESRTITTLENSSRALMSVISDVLDYSRLEAGAVRMEAAPFQPAALAAEVASILAPEVQRNGVDLRTRQDHPAPLTWPGDVKRVKQVLINLAGNAVKFVPEGRVEISSWTTAAPGRLWFAVTDNGPGVPADRLETVFEPFVQLDTGRLPSPAGTGLGLSISRRLVELMGGRIHAVDTGGRGARFEFWLPEVPAPPTPSADPFPPTVQ
jgi:signal transduction histidine kinase